MTYPLADVLTVEGARLYWSHGGGFPVEMDLRLPQPALSSSANWSGYLSSWRLYAGRLWLTGIQRRMMVKGSGAQYQEIDLAPIFRSYREDVQGTRAMLADWFTGLIDAYPSSTSALWHTMPRQRWLVVNGHLSDL